MGRDLTSELDRQAESSRLPSWNPEIGETLTGTIVAFTTRMTKFGETRLAIVDREDGEGQVQLWLSSVVLKGLFEQQRPRCGDRIGVRYGGRHEQKNYHLYSLVVDRDEPELTPAPARQMRPPKTPYVDATVSMGPAEPDAHDPFN
jgi:hypothetical protein